MENTPNNVLEKKLDGKKKRLFISAMIGVTIGASALLVLAGELAARYKKIRRINARITVLEKLVRSNAVFNKSLFKGFKGKEEATIDFFDKLAKIPMIYRPYIIWRRAPNYQSKPINLNSLGYRGPEFAIKKAPNIFRILIYGGSVVWGTGALSDAETISAQLEEWLNERSPQGKRFEVINCGESGFQTTQEAIFLLIEGVYLSPDLVVFLDGYNDPVQPYKQYPAGYPWFYSVLKKRLRRKKAEVFTIDNELDYLKKQRELVWKGSESELLSRLNSIASRGQERILKAAWSENDTTPEEYALRHFYNIRCIRGMAQEFGFQAVFAIQPVPICFKPLHPQERQALETLKKNPTYHRILTWAENHYIDYTDQVIALCKKQEIPVLDFRKLFKNNSEPIYFDSCHMTGDGYHLVAEQLGGWLIEKGFVVVRK